MEKKEEPFTLDEAIEHAEEVAGTCSTSCQREHKQLADWLRELKERRKHGNAAAMRAALIIAKKDICHHAKHICQSLSWENSNTQSNCADVLCAHRDFCKAKTAINAALSAPPRNCDMFGGNYSKLHSAWFEWTGTPEGRMPDGTCKMTFARWLLERAEGEDDGSK